MKWVLVFSLLVFPAVLLSLGEGSSLVANAQAADNDLDDEVEVDEVEDNAIADDGTEEEEDDSVQTGASADADTTILFTKPITQPSASLELPAGQIVEFLVGFQNKGKQDFVLETLDASFRYPMDFTFYIQNFSTIAYNKVVKPTNEATLAYSFITPESFAGRPFGLNIHLNYRDLEGNLFGESVFNETVNVVELDEGLDGETFFLYLFLAACGVLLLVVGQQFLVSVGKKRGSGKKVVVETGTSNPNDVDYDWLPKETLNTINRTSPKSSPKANKHQSPKASKQNAASKQQSPRQRKAKRSAGRDD